MEVLHISRWLAEEVEKLRFAPPVTHVYNPLIYAKTSHEDYLRRFGSAPKEVLLIGMNPGPWGMAQTGVPFGDVTLVREWMGLETDVGKPKREHPKRSVEGFACARSEVSGTRLWSWARDRFGSADQFFRRFFVWNYCPLAFLEESGRNRTPDKLPANEREALFLPCDEALRRLVRALDPQKIIGIGKFAEKRASAALRDRDLTIGHMLHPSPASPAANRNWADAADATLAQYEISV